MKALKTFLKPSEVSQKSTKIKIKLIFISIPLFEMHGAAGVKINSVGIPVSKLDT